MSVLVHIVLLALWPGCFLWVVPAMWWMDRRPVSETEERCARIDEDIDANEAFPWKRITDFDGTVDPW